MPDEAAAAARASWWKGQLSLPNIIAVAAIVGATAAWQRSIEARNELQDYRISELSKKLEDGNGVYARRDIIDQRFSYIIEQLGKLDTKVDGITRAVR